MLKMVDISSWQGAPDIRTLNADIVASKATEGTGYMSPVFGDDWRRTRHQAHKARIAYHYFHPSISGVAQAHFFLNTVQNAVLESGDMLAVDLENTDGLDAEVVSHEARQFITTVEHETRCKCIVYTYINFAESGNCNGLGDQPLWIADPSSIPGSPRVPLPWHTWLFHQWGAVRGIDQDAANVETLENLLQYGALISSPEPTTSQRIVWVSDGETETERLVSYASLAKGFELKAGKATFRILG